MREHFMFDIGQVMDKVFEATEKFKNAFKEGFPNFGGEEAWGFHWDENTDFYPLYSYPPANVYLNKNRELILEFALAGFDEKDVDLQFQGDYLVLSAKPSRVEEEGVRYFKRRLKFREVAAQKYFVPEKRFDREKVKAVFRHGILKVTVPPREGYSTGDGVKVEIVREGD